MILYIVMLYCVYVGGPGEAYWNAKSKRCYILNTYTNSCHGNLHPYAKSIQAKQDIAEVRFDTC